MSKQNNSVYYIGCMTGTSVDRYADFVIAQFNPSGQPSLQQNYQILLPDELRQALLLLSGAVTIETSETIDAKQIKHPRPSRHAIEAEFTQYLAHCFIKLIQQYILPNAPNSTVILSPHGQTIKHQPLAQSPVCDVLIDWQYLANLTGYPVVGQHRQCALPVSMAAPLAPVLIRQLFADVKYTTVVLNGGGIANLSVIPKDQTKPLLGYDIGPANGPLDSVVQYVLAQEANLDLPSEINTQLMQHGFDYQGQWASTGQVQDDLLDKLYTHPYFQLPQAKKSADRRDFGLSWILGVNTEFNYCWTDVMATLAELVVCSISDAIINAVGTDSYRLISYGGLTHNQFIMQAINKRLMHNARANNKECSMVPMLDMGYDPDHFEALLMAYLGYCVHNHYSVDLNYCKRAGISSEQAKIIPGKLFYPNK